MSDARQARVERRAALASRIAQTAPVGGRPRRSPSPAVNAATGLAGNEQQASSQHLSVRQDGRTATPSLTPAGSSSRALRAPMEARAALIAANELQEDGGAGPSGRTAAAARAAVRVRVWAAARVGLAARVGFGGSGRGGL